MKTKLLSFICCALLGSPVSAQLVIPQPQSISVSDDWLPCGSFDVTYHGVRGADRSFLSQCLTDAFGQSAAKRSKSVCPVTMTCTGTKDEARRAGTERLLQAYTLTVDASGIDLKAPTPMGLYYGVQTLRQLRGPKGIQYAQVQDEPRFVYRGIMIDCSRHFWTLDVLKRQIDAMAYFKLDRLHLHLTDAAGWRMEIKKYPRLTEETAYRTASNWADWWDAGVRTYCHKDDPGAYGGFYTQKELKDLVKYAARRHVTIIPEIEMPGHSNEVCYAYPELSCSGKPYVDGDLCPGNEQTYDFLEGVLKEVMRIFPSTYIHIGGDEAGRTAWETCPKCQQRMREEGLKSTAELQSYLTARIERYLNAHGRQLLGWDEILEGKLAPNAAVMSWRGEEGGMTASAQRHHVVMTPGNYCYLDHYQDKPSTQPLAFGSYVPLRQVYSYNPVPDDKKGTLMEQYVDGVQGNLWTERVETPSHLEYMLYPRAMAIAEVGWSNHKTTYDNFHNRALAAIDTLRARGYNTFDLRHEAGPRRESKILLRHDAVGKTVKYQAPYAPQYRASGDAALTDGRGGDWSYSDGRWQGFISDSGLDVVIDMGAVQDIHTVRASFLQSISAVIFFPREVIISVSDDGKNFTQISDKHYEDKQVDYDVYKLTWSGKARGRYVRYQALPVKSNAWVFTDEVEVNPAD